VNGLSTEEIAAVLGKSPEAANSLLQRARQGFRELGAGTFDLTDREDEE
jgi:DNA-directed RNA polymerase specialized sigma24 family protein